MEIAKLVNHKVSCEGSKRIVQHDCQWVHRKSTFEHELHTVSDLIFKWVGTYSW